MNNMSKYTKYEVQIQEYILNYIKYFHKFI